MLPMKKIAVVALKGGVGKSSLVAGLGLSLVARKYRVGFLDIDITGSNLYSALGLDKPPKLGLDNVAEKIIVPEVNGYWLLSTASHTGEGYAVLWESSQHGEIAAIRKTINEALIGGLNTTELPASREQLVGTLEAIRNRVDDILTQSKWHFVRELLSPEIVTWPEPLDFLIVDLPPSTSHEMLSFFEEVKDLFGVVMVSQPTQISNTGLVRTVDLLRVKQIPIIGLVANVDGFLNRHGEIEYQFLSPRVDLKQVAIKAGIPFLLSIPQTGDSRKVEPYFDELAGKVIKAKPVILKEITPMRKLKRKIVKGVARRL